jgi:Protein of unknown function DUF72
MRVRLQIPCTSNARHYEPELLLGTSAFTAAGWEGSFYPASMKPRDFLQFYATQFAAVELDSTFYGTPIGCAMQDSGKSAHRPR